MIGMLKGTVWNTDSERIVLDVGGVGYLLQVPAGCFANSKKGEERVYYTHLVVREDDLTLFGFNTYDEKSLFIQLLGVSGIGPKAALALLSVFSVKQIKSAILREDVAQLTEVPGIGAKTAKRLILELKEKIKDLDLDTSGEEPETLSGVPNHEALDTLLALGFSRIESREVLTKVTAKGALTTEEQVKEALRLLAQHK